jgi:hypothetical protein
MTYVSDAVGDYLEHLDQRDEVTGRPIRIDGLSAIEIQRALEGIERAIAPGRVAVLGPRNREQDHLVNAERATRYRNQVDASDGQSRFVLLVPRGQTVESSLDEPAFSVVARAHIFRHALARLRVSLGLGLSDVEALRDVSIIKQAEAIYQFLRAWSDTDQMDPLATYHFLGLLGDSQLPRADIDQTRSRLIANRKATDAILKPGQSLSRVLDQLSTEIGLDRDQSGEDVARLVAWFRKGQRDPTPVAIDFALWERSDDKDPIVRWTENLLDPPHRGWSERDGATYVDSPEGVSIVEWTPVRADAETTYEVHLLDAASHLALRKIGRGKTPSKRIKWSAVATEAVRQELRELNEAGDVEGYSLILRVDVYQGKRWIKELLSHPFFLDLPPVLDAVTTGAVASAGHALYQFHAEQKAQSPRLVRHLEEPTGYPRVVLETDDGRTRETTLDLPRSLREAQSFLLQGPEHLGHLQMALRDGRWEFEVVEPIDLGPQGVPFQSARKDLFAAIGDSPLEAVDWFHLPVRQAAERYVLTYSELAQGYANLVDLAEADRLRAASLAAIDGISVKLGIAEADDVLLIAPTHPASVAWMLEFSDLIASWTHGKFDGLRKPPYRGVVEDLAIGPRAMVMPVPDAGSITWYGYAGNLTRTWACYTRLDAGGGLRALDWESEVTSALGLSNRRIGGGRMDSARIGARLKKYAVLHPYVGELRVGAVVADDGMTLLDALKVIDEPTGTPRGARSVREVRYQLHIFGPESPHFARAIDDLVANPGDDRWRRHSPALLDNPETVLSPGFAYSRHPIRVGRGGAGNLWQQLSTALAELGDEGIHVLVLGPMLATTVGSASIQDDESSLALRGLIARPKVRHVATQVSSAFEGDWLLTIAVPTSASDRLPHEAAAALAALLRKAAGVGPITEVGLRVSLASATSKALKVAHEVADWVIVADPLFAIDIMDRPPDRNSEALLLDFTPEFEPYPGARVVVTTASMREIDALADPVGKVFGGSATLTRVLASISARLLLGLSNPTRQVVHGLTGLALTRSMIHARLPSALVIPADGHEDMFAITTRGKIGKLADLIAITLDNDELRFHIFESKWSGAQNLTAQLDAGAHQAATTKEVLVGEYIKYSGVDRDMRLESLRDVVLFHFARASRHGIEPAFSRKALANAVLEVPQQAEVSATVVAWCPDFAIGESEIVDDRGVVRIIRGSSGIRDELSAVARILDPSRKAEPSVEDDETESAVMELLDLEPLPVVDEVVEQAPDNMRHTDIEVPGSTGAVNVPTEEHRSEPDPAPHAQSDPSASVAAVQCVRLGWVAGTSKAVDWCPADLSNGHLILVGGSGAGKTTALRHIAGGIRDRGVPVFVLDFHGDLSDPAGHEEVFEFDYQGNESFVNPFHLEPTFGARLTPSRLKWEFVEAFRSHYSTMGVHQTNFISDLIEDAFIAKGITDDPNTWANDVSFADVLEQFERTDATDAAKARIRSYMKRFAEWRIFHGGTPIAVEDALRRSIRLDLSQLDESARNILADVVLRRLFLTVRALGPLPETSSGWSKFRAYVVIDEAQLLMGGVADARASLAKYAAEARKFGLGLVLATQLRDNVPAEIWGNIDTRFFMQALDPFERARNAKAAGVPEQTLQSLGRGQGILNFSSQPGARPTIVQIRPFWM